MFSILVKNLGDICAFTKQNPPYSCARQVPPPFLQRASLAYANAALLYGVMSAFFAQMLYRSAVKDVESAIEESLSESLSTDGDLRSLVRKLRLTVDRLDSKVDHLGTGQDQLRTGQGTHEELIQKLLSKEGGR